MEIRFGPDFLTVMRGDRTYKISKDELAKFLAQVYDEELTLMAYHVSEYKTLKDNKISGERK